MSNHVYTVTGTVKDGNIVTLDETLPIQSAKVRLTIEPLADDAPRSLQQVLAEIYARQQDSGHRPPTREEVDAYLPRRTTQLGLVPVQIYLDAAPIIYLVEKVAPYAIELGQRLSDPNITLVTSDLSRMECRIKPFREGNQILLQAYGLFFQQAIREIILLSPVVLDRATEIRARYGFRTPDAIHLAAAMLAKCDYFLTNDQSLRRFPEITVEVLQG